MANRLLFSSLPTTAPLTYKSVGFISLNIKHNIAFVHIKNTLLTMENATLRRNVKYTLKCCGNITFDMQNLYLYVNNC